MHYYNLNGKNYRFVPSEKLNDSISHSGTATPASSQKSPEKDEDQSDNSFVSNDTSFSDFYTLRHIDENDKGLQRIIDEEIDKDIEEKAMSAFKDGMKENENV